MPAVPTSLILIEGDRARLILGLSAAFVSGFLGKDKNTRRQDPHAARHFARAIRRGDYTSKPEGNATAGAWEWVKINEKIKRYAVLSSPVLDLSNRVSIAVALCECPWGQTL